jgi:peptidoglycan-N-acetylglucosamine deacetylase
MDFVGKLLAILGIALALFAAGPSHAVVCESNREVLGTSRVLAVNPLEHKRVGTLQYAESLPLSDHEVVLTFDDGPLGSYTARILDALAAECVRATFFMVGRMAKADPQLVQRVAHEGHTIGSHTQNHPMNLRFLNSARVAQEIDSGIETIGAALGGTHFVAPFFRIPGLYPSPTIEDYAAGRDLMIWSADLHGSDWERIGAQGVLRRMLQRLQAKRRGILLLHDIQPATALALPQLLKQLRHQGYRVVHVEPARTSDKTLSAIRSHNR